MALRQLSKLPEVEALDTGRGSHRHLGIGAFDGDSDSVPLSVECEGGLTISAALPGVAQWRRIAVLLLGATDPHHPDVEPMFEDLVTARAHVQLNRDVLVTLSPWLLKHRSQALVREANPRAPSEAAKIVGLLLRSRGNYTHTVHGEFKKAFDRGLFYWVLARHRLPSMWRYFKACVEAGKVRSDDALGLGQSVLTRCVRALQARDAIGVQFYLPQDNNSRDTIMYHFDYLTLVLAGAIDAQARVAYRAYRMTESRESWASFAKEEFQSELRNRGAVALHSVVTQQHFQDVRTLLYEPRNTIHGACLPTLAYCSAAEPEESFVHVPQQYSQRLWDAAARVGSPENWGLKRHFEVLLEPYTYSVALVEESFKLIDEIADATDVAGLFPPGHSIPPLTDGPPEDDVFGVGIRKRLDVLG